MQQAQARPASTPIHDHVRERRAALREQLASAPGEDEPLWGLALSGGGIRSATFALGLISGLADKRVFSRFDLMSTVSGGGYAGSAVGKLYSDPEAHAGELERDLGSMPGSWFVWWLRATSRYLIPRGAKDMLFALTLYVRSLLAVHTEVAVVCIAAGALLALVSLLVWGGLYVLFSANPQLLGTVGWMFPSWMSTYWLLLALPAAMGVPLASAYWTIPSGPGTRGFNEWALTGVLLTLAIVGVGAAATFPSFWAAQRDGTLRVTCFAVGAFLGLAGLGPIVARAALVRRGKGPAVTVARQRNRLTNWLSFVLYFAVGLLAAGALDRVAWWIAFGDHAALLQWMPAVIAAGIALARALAAQVPSGDQAAATSSRFGFFVAESAGWLLLALLLVFWVSVTYRLGLANLFGSPPAAELEFGAAGGILGAMVLVPFIYVFITGRNEDFANLSSLHMFYRARLTRSFLGAANQQRFGHPPLARVDGDAVTVSQKPKVYDVVASDTVKLSAYTPHKRGGPVHILNATINQTQAALGGLFNQDRKGQYLSITSDGLCRIGLGKWQQRQDVADSELPAWVAISGAAFAPGLGGQTSSGLAVLLFMAGVRLGYWWDTDATERQGRFVKYSLLRDEARAKFRGAEYRYRYLSDGGHFENTGAYTLLRERTRLIVLSDAGADPDYGYDDLENLVRKARIDLLAQIRFLEEADLKQLGLPQFGSLDQLKDPQSDACIALARVDYANEPEHPNANRFGWIVYVKPNLFSAAPVDLRNYARDHRPFPQEPTTDQFFSESQWESYFMLGRVLGMQLDRATLGRVASTNTSTLTSAAPRGGTRGDTAAPPAPKPTVRFGPRAAVIATSGLSITALIALATTTWQAFDKYAEQHAARLHAYDTEVTGLIGLYERFAAGHTELAPDLTSKVASLAATNCRDGVNTLRRAAPQTKAVFEKLTAQCQEHAKSQQLTPACAIVADPKTYACVVGGVRQVDAPAYWAVDYTDRTWAEQRLAIHQPIASSTTEVAQVAPAEPPVTTASADAAASALAPVSAAAVPNRAIALPPLAAPQITSAPPHPASAPASTGASKCAGKRVYIQIYSPLDLSKAQEWSNYVRTLDARVPRTEDVMASAARDSRPAPRPVTTQTLVYHTSTEYDCATELQHKDSSLKIRPLTRGLTPTPGVLELWIPPSR